MHETRVKKKDSLDSRGLMLRTGWKDALFGLSMKIEICLDEV